MKKSHVALCMAAILALTLALPAVGAPSLGQRLTKLSKKVSRISREQAREKTVIRKRTVLSDDSGSAEGSVPCPGNTYVTGGGGEWEGDPVPFDIITATIPDGEGWYVSADSTRKFGAQMTVYAVCARIGR